MATTSSSNCVLADVPKIIGPPPLISLFFLDNGYLISQYTKSFYMNKNLFWA
ncbi:hypothetical protein ACJX0J_012635, partial [Zea mays]